MGGQPFDEYTVFRQRAIPNKNALKLLQLRQSKLFYLSECLS